MHVYFKTYVFKTKHCHSCRVLIVVSTLALQFRLEVQVGAQIQGIWWRNNSVSRDKGTQPKCFYQIFLLIRCKYPRHSWSDSCPGHGTLRECWTTRGSTWPCFSYPPPPNPQTPEGTLRPCHFLFISFLYWLPCRLLLWTDDSDTPPPPPPPPSSAPNRYASSPNMHAQYIKMKAFIKKGFSKHMQHACLWNLRCVICHI